MKSVLISTRPKWVEKICNKIGEDETGKAIYEKRIEVRKSAPQEVPFKGYIYCTKDKQEALNNHNGNIFLSPKGWQCHSECNGKVIGEFICDKVERLEEHIEQGGLYYTLSDTFNEQAQLDNWELHDYGKGKTLYGWHISDLKIYDKPKELSEFRTPKNPHRIGNSHSWILDGYKKITRPPQSWCYVEDLGEEE